MTPALSSQTRNMIQSDLPLQGDSHPMSASYLDKLNPEQRRAVEHGNGSAGLPAPPLVIAGAGSGKTNTPAHRGAHVVLRGTAPRRIVLMTFSRQAATEMTRRVQRIACGVIGDSGRIM